VWSVGLHFDHFLIFVLALGGAQTFVKVGARAPVPGWSQRHFRVTV